MESKCQYNLSLVTKSFRPPPPRNFHLVVYFKRTKKLFILKELKVLHLSSNYDK